MSGTEKNTRRKQLKQTIEAQESLRGTLDDAVVDAAISTLKKELASLVLQRKVAPNE
jgi:hypothetical protein